MTLKTRIQSQRDARWGSIFLGFNTIQPYTIYGYGCLITSLANYIDKQPDEVNQILKDGNGFDAGGGLFFWSKCSLLGLKESYVSPRYQAVALSTPEVNKLIGFLDLGFPALCEVDFNPADDAEQMHFVLAVGHTDNEIIVVDPWEGQLETWSFSAFQRNTYQYRIYDKKLTEGGDSDTLPVLKKDFENLVRKATLYDWILQLFKLSDSETIVKETFPKFTSYEDRIMTLEKEKRAMTDEAAAIRKELETTKGLLKEAQDNNFTLTVTVGEDQKKINTLAVKVDDLTKRLQDLTDQSTKPLEDPWYIKILKFFKR